MNILQLQNGSDIRGTSMSEGGAAVNLDSNAAYLIAGGFVHWLRNDKKIENPIISIGKDSRLSGDMLKDSFIEGLSEYGVNGIFDCGLCSTPAMYETTKEKGLNADGAVMVTASHLPFDKNGFKFFTKDGGTDKGEIKKILTYAEELSGTIIKPKHRANVTKVDFISEYAQIIREMIRKESGCDRPLEGYKIIMDAGNGVGGFFCSQVLSPLGADTSASVFLSPDGTFPNHIPNPENKAAMSFLCELVKKEQADLGIMFDTDADRAALVGKDGISIGSSRLIALMSAIVLEKHPGATIVTDSVTSDGLKIFIESLGGVHHRYMRGYNNVIKEAKRLSAAGTFAPLAIETSGHCALYDNNYLDDGAYLSAVALIKFSELKRKGEDFSDYLSSYQSPAEGTELRITVTAPNHIEFGNKLIDEFKLYCEQIQGCVAEESNYEGARIKFTAPLYSGWALMRLSLHEPMIVINIESNIIGGAEKIKETLMVFLEKYKNELQGV